MLDMFQNKKGDKKDKQRSRDLRVEVRDEQQSYSRTRNE